MPIDQKLLNLYGRLGSLGVRTLNAKLKELSMDQVDNITMDVPLFIRMMEVAREELKSDSDLHVLVARIIAASKNKKVLTMEDYEAVMPPSHPEDHERQEEQASNGPNKARALYTADQTVKDLQRAHPKASVVRTVTHRQDGIVVYVSVDGKIADVKTYTEDWEPVKGPRPMNLSVLSRLAVPEVANNNASIAYVARRIAQTFVPFAKTGVPAYTSNICHAQVAKGILKRGNVDDRVVMFGTEAGDVIHSILTDSNSRILVDSWKSGTSKYEPGKGYWKDGELNVQLFDEPVIHFYDEYQR